MDQYAVIGNPVAHSKSPEIHSAFAAQEGVNIEYRRILAEETNFISTVNSFRDHNGRGLNVTVPFKESAYQHCKKLNDYARIAKAVNTIQFAEDSGWEGANTDGIGLVRDLTENLNIIIKNINILVVGAGGAVRGILLPLLQEAPANLVITNRTMEKAHAIATDFEEQGPVTCKSATELSYIQFDLIINATSASLSNAVPSLPASIINSNTFCYDLAYSDQDTAFLKWAKNYNAGGTCDGLGMLIEQAAESYFLWRNFRPDTRVVFNQLRLTN